MVKRSAVVEEMLVHEGPARVFDCEEDAIDAIKGGSWAIAGRWSMLLVEQPRAMSTVSAFSIGGRILRMR